MKRLLLVLVAVLTVLPSIAATKVAEKGKKVRVHYVGTVDDGKVFDSSYNRNKPLEFVVGSGIMLKDFDAGLVGMQKGETKTFTIKAANAYGEVDSKKVFKIKKSQIAEGIEIKPGAKLNMNAMGRQYPARIIGIDEEDTETVYVDLNHLLAGKDLTFEVELISVEDNKKSKS